VKRSKTACLSGLSYELGRLRPIADIVDDGESGEAVEILLSKGAQTYSQFDESLIDVIKRSAANSLRDSGIRAEEVGAVLVVTESFSGIMEASVGQGRSQFREARDALFDALAAVGVTKAPVFCTTFGGSSNFLQAVFMTMPLIETGRIDYMLIVCADRQPPAVSRFMYDAVALIGDGVATCVATLKPRPNADAYELEYVGISPFANAADLGDWGRMLLDMYRTAKCAAADCYDKTQRQPRDFGWLILSNYNKLSNQVFSRLLGFGDERTYLNNVARTGHVPACDHLINLKDLCLNISLPPRTPLLLFVNGPISCGTISVIAR
jgi:3-oxoacyl-[acyl-carrier-protein] synthase III